MKFRIILIGVVGILLWGVPASDISAATPQELAERIEATKRERDALLEEQARLERELDAISRQGQTLASTVKALDATRKKLAADIGVTQSKISSTNLNINMLENSLNEKDYQISVHRQAIASAIQQVAEHDSAPLLLAFLSSRQLSDVWGDRTRLEDLSATLNEEIHALRETKVVLDREKELKERSKQNLVKLTSELGGQKQVVEANKSAQEKLLAVTKSKEAEYERMIADLVAKQKEFESELFRFENELRVALDPSLYPASSPGLLKWPLDSVYITQRFGKTSASGRLYASGTHNGVDFRAPMGTPVKSVLSGVVTGVGNTDEQRGCYSYGRWILVKHPNGLSSIYSHLSAAVVKNGQSVETGQVIGYSGGTPGTNGAGYSTGPHLHLGLFASQGVQVRQFTTSINCKQVFVPMADAKAYLDPLAYLPQ